VGVSVIYRHAHTSQAPPTDLELSITMSRDSHIRTTVEANDLDTAELESFVAAVSAVFDAVTLSVWINALHTAGTAKLIRSTRLSYTNSKTTVINNSINNRLCVW